MNFSAAFNQLWYRVSSYPSTTPDAYVVPSRLGFTFFSAGISVVWDMYRASQLPPRYIPLPDTPGTLPHQRCLIDSALPLQDYQVSCWIISYFRQSLCPLMSFFSSLIALMISLESMFVPGFLSLAVFPLWVLAWLSSVLLTFDMELFFLPLLPFFLFQLVFGASSPTCWAFVSVKCSRKCFQFARHLPPPLAIHKNGFSHFYWLKHIVLQSPINVHFPSWTSFFPLWW